MMQGWEHSLNLSACSEQGAWEKPMQETHRRLAKAFFHNNLVTHPDPLPTRSSRAKFFRTYSWTTEISRVDLRYL